MVHNTGKKWVKLLVLMYLIVAVIGSFADSAGEPFLHLSSNNDNLSSYGFLSSKVHAVDWLAEETIISKSHSHSSAQLRQVLFRIFTLTGVISAAVYLLKANIKIKSNNIPIIKNLIVLSLRI